MTPGGYKTEILTTSDHHRISVDHYQNGSNTLIVVAPGFFNSKQSILLQQLCQEFSRNYDVAIMDFRGHGQSGGLFSWTSKESLDLMCVLERFRPEYHKLGLVGFSLGAATSIITAAKIHTIDSLVAISAPTALRAIEYNFWQLDFENDILFNLFQSQGRGVRPGPPWLNKQKPVDVVQDVKSPVLYIHGTRDWLVKPWHSQALYDKTRTLKKLAIIENGPHAEYLIRKNKQETFDLMQDWFQETLK